MNKTTEYDAAERVTRTIDPDGNTNRTYYNALGKPDSTIDKFGNTNSFLYDARGNVIQTTYANGTLTRTVYDDNARAILTTDRNQITGTSTGYDALGRVTNTVRLANVRIDIVPDANNPGQMQSVIGAAGTPLSTNSTEYLANGWVKSRTGPDGQKTSYDYWADGKVMTVIDPLTNQTFYSYDDDGRQTLVWDALNHDTRFQYDAVNRVVRTIYPDKTYGSNIFDIVGQRIGQVDQAGLLTQFGFSTNGQLTSVTKPQVPDPENGYLLTNAVWSYRYDPSGTLKGSSPENGNVVGYQGRCSTMGSDGSPNTNRICLGCQCDVAWETGEGDLFRRR